ncbi:MAG TPA: NADPH-dependent F420 reductase [Actinomycetota bacterium]|nr:NADPH-dependent F420 reductase [Actinomycetota bacterium]
MKIGVIGSGNIGSTVAKLFVTAGHDVVIANARGPESLAGLVGELGPKASAGTVDQAAAGADLVLVAVPYRANTELPPGPFAGKIVIDATNYYPGDFRIPELDRGELSSSEYIARHLSGARLVKAFNNMQSRRLATLGDTALPEAERHALFLCGDDEDAKARVAGLIREVGFAPVDTGTLTGGSKLQGAGGVVYNRMLTGAQGAAEVAANGGPAV